MKFLVVLACVCAVALAAPANPNNPDADAQIIRQQADIDPQGNFQNDLETSNGIRSQAQGQLQENKARASPEDPTHIITQSGSYSYTDPETKATYTVNWTADQNGFHPEGAHLPVAPVA